MTDRVRQALEAEVAGLAERLRAVEARVAKVEAGATSAPWATVTRASPMRYGCRVCTRSFGTPAEAEAHEAADHAGGGPRA